MSDTKRQCVFSWVFFVLEGLWEFLEVSSLLDINWPSPLFRRPPKLINDVKHSYLMFWDSLKYLLRPWSSETWYPQMQYLELGGTIPSKPNEPHMQHMDFFKKWGDLKILWILWLITICQMFLVGFVGSPIIHFFARSMGRREELPESVFWPETNTSVPLYLSTNQCC